MDSQQKNWVGKCLRHSCDLLNTWLTLLKRSQTRSQGPLSSYLEKVPWLRLVTCLCIQIKSAPGVGLWLNCVNTVYGGESCFALQTLFWKLRKLFVRGPAWPMLRFYPKFYEYEMLIKREVCLFSLLFFLSREEERGPWERGWSVRSRFDVTALTLSRFPMGGCELSATRFRRAQKIEGLTKSKTFCAKLLHKISFII